MKTIPDDYSNYVSVPLMVKLFHARMIASEFRRIAVLLGQKYIDIK